MIVQVGTTFSTYFVGRGAMPTEPFVAAISDYFFSVIKTKDDCIKYIKIIQSVISGEKTSYPEPGFASFDHYKKDIAILYEYENSDDVLVELHPTQVIRMISAFYILLNEGKSTFMEVEVTEFTPVTDGREFPIPPEVKALPLIRLSDPIPLPPLN